VMPQVTLRAIPDWRRGTDRPVKTARPACHDSL
jgi:hypothetical protein